MKKLITLSRQKTLLARLIREHERSWARPQGRKNKTNGRCCRGSLSVQSWSTMYSIKAWSAKLEEKRNQEKESPEAQGAGTGRQHVLGNEFRIRRRIFILVNKLVSPLPSWYHIKLTTLKTQEPSALSSLSLPGTPGSRQARCPATTAARATTRYASNSSTLGFPGRLMPLVLLLELIFPLLV